MDNHMLEHQELRMSLEPRHNEGSWIHYYLCAWCVRHLKLDYRSHNIKVKTHGVKSYVHNVMLHFTCPLLIPMVSVDSFNRKCSFLAASNMFPTEMRTQWRSTAQTIMIFLTFWNFATNIYVVGKHKRLQRQPIGASCCCVRECWDRLHSWHLPFTECMRNDSSTKWGIFLRHKCLHSIGGLVD